MKIATVYVLNDDGEWKPKGTIKIENGQMVADSLGATRIMDSKFAWGDRSYSKADGEEFLDILPKTVNGSYVAVRVEDDAPQAYARAPEDAFAPVLAPAPSITEKSKTPAVGSSVTATVPKHVQSPLLTPIIPKVNERMNNDAEIDESVIDSAKDAMDINEENDPGYLYHFTLKDNLRSIGKGGLQPRGSVNPSISATRTATPSIADTLFADAGTEGLVLLRFKEQGEWRDDPEFMNDIFAKSNNGIAPNDIEVKTVLGWKPLVRVVGKPLSFEKEGYHSVPKLLRILKTKEREEAK